MKENDIRQIAMRMKLITVEDVNQYTIAQLVYAVANKVNEVISNVTLFENEVDENIQYLLSKGTMEDVTKIFGEWLNDGTFDRLINQSVYRELEARVTGAETDIRLANDEIEKLSDMVDNQTDGSPKGVYANLNDLKIAKPTGDRGIYITSDDGKWCYWNGSEWVAGGTYQTTGIGENTITRNMMAFPVGDAFRTTNLFNRDKAERGKYINEFGNSVEPLDGSDRCASDFIPVLGGVQYTASDNFTHYAFYSASKTFISHKADPTTSFVAPSNASYVRLTIMTPERDTFSLEKGKKASSGKPYYQAIIGDKYITDSMLANKYIKCIRSYNLFNKDTVIKDMYVVWGNGQLNSPLVPGEYYASDFIEVNPSRTYTVRHQGQCAFYDENFGYIRGMDSGANTFTAPANARYFRITINSTANLETQQMVEGEVMPDYQPYFIPVIPVNSINFDMLNGELKGMIDGSYHSNLKINIIGDSITWGFESGTGNQVSKPYPVIIEELLKCTVNSYGISGSTIAGDGTTKGYVPIWKRYIEMNKDVTLNVIFAGTNDFGSDRQIELGTIADTNANTSFYGGLNALCEGLIANFPNSRTVLITPMQRGIDNTNTYGKRLIDYVDAVINVGAKYSIPVIDLYRCGNMPLTVKSFKDKYSPDGLHLTQEGYDRLGQVIANQLKNM